MQVSILGRRWSLRFRPLRTCRGSCDPPDAPGKEIRVDSRLPEQEQLEVLVHEMLHAADWTKDESWVEQVAADIARTLWKLGWRNNKPL